MPRYTLQGWWCICGQKNSPDARKCSKCQFNRHQKNAQVSSSERAVVFYNPATGEHRTPARSDQPIPKIYANQGFERREILNMTSWEKEAGVVHEASNYNSGNAEYMAPTPQVKHDPEVIRDLAKDMGEAFASGPFTGGDNIIDTLPSLEKEV